MFAVLDAAAVAGIAVVGNVQNIRHKAAAVVAVGFRPDVQAAGAGLLEEFGKFDGLVHRGALGVFAQIHNIFLNAAVKDLDDEVTAHPFADAFDDLADDAAAVFDALAAVLVGALLVDAPGQIGGEIMVAGTVDFNAVKPGFVISLCAVDELLDLGLDFFGGLHPAGAETALQVVFLGDGGGSAREHGHVVHLGDDRGVHSVHGVGNGLVAGNALVGGNVQGHHVQRGALRFAGDIGHGPALCAGHRGGGDHRGGFKADHAHAAFAKAGVVAQSLIVRPEGGGLLHLGAGRALDDTVFQGDAADLQRGENVGIIGGIFCKAGVLRIENTAHRPFLTGCCGSGASRGSRRFRSSSGGGLAGGAVGTAAQDTDGCGAGDPDGGPFHKVSSG